MSDSKQQLKSLRGYTSPRYWPTWLLYAFLKILAILPFSIQITVGKALGKLSLLIARDRREACEINIRLCFPELSADEQEELIRKIFISNGIGLVEIAMAWFSDPKRYEDKISVHGAEHLKAAKSQGRGVLLVGAHFSTLELGGLLFNKVGRFDATFRPNKNPLFNAMMFNGRKRSVDGVIDRKDIRGAMRSLKSGRVLWYAPDQDYGPKNSIFAPFFGVPAATITATSRFARFNDSAIVFYSHYRNEDNSGYHIHFSEPLKGYPTGDDVQDATIINRYIETAIRKQPDQYLWLHKRFKTQAAGKSARPYNDKKHKQNS
ncbi:MAG: LpxL/LpxP family Kdo(2)-lipid IV(A) lauroyl/palmitoleoyl acyltransferase [Pseudohongiellaceae bacterium]